MQRSLLEHRLLLKLHNTVPSPFGRTVFYVSTTGIVACDWKLGVYFSTYLISPIKRFAAASTSCGMVNSSLTLVAYSLMF